MDVRLTQIDGYTFVTNPRDKYVGKSLEVYGEFSYGEVQLIQQLVKPQGCIVEVGANIGSHTAFLAREVVPQGKVYAFEPRRQLFQLLCANVAVNGAQNVHAFQEGLGAEEQWLEEATIPDLRGEANLGGLPIGALPGHGEFLHIRRLDDYLERIRRVNLIKADVEGWEADVLRGGARMIARDRPLLYVENHYPEKSVELIDTILALDYRLWWHFPPMFRADNRAGNRFNIFGRVRSINMVCIPAERKANVKDLRPVLSAQERP